MKLSNYILAFFSFLLLSFIQSDFDEMALKYGKGKAPFITPEQLSKRIISNETFFLLDTRETKEYNVSHIKSALPVGYDKANFSCINKKADKNSVIICYCSVGYRSNKIAEQLIKKGYKNVYNLYGGIFNWVNKGYKVINIKGEETNRVHAYNKSWSKWLMKGEKVYE